MSNDAPVPVPEATASFEERIEILFHELDLAARWDRPSILFAIYKSESVRDEVNRKLGEALATISQNSYFIETKVDSGFDFLTQISQLPDLSKTVLFIDGFHWNCGTEGVQVFTEFNKHREYFIDNNIRAIFWLFEDEVSEFATNATECWILRHRVIDFIDEPMPAPQLTQSIESAWQSPEDLLIDGDASEFSPHEVLDFKDGEKADATHVNALLVLGILFWRKGSSQDSLKYLQAASEMATVLENQALQAQCQNALALVQTELGNLDDAVAAYEHAISLSPGSSFLWNNLGQLLSRNERNEDAIAAFKHALDTAPQDFLGWDGIGHVYLKLGLYQNAIDAFGKALDIAPNYEYSWTGLGQAYLESGQLESSEDALQKAVSLNNHIIEAWVCLGKCLALQDRDNQAIIAYGKALELDSRSVEAWDNLGRLHLQRQAYDESVTAYQNAISINPQFSDAYLGMASALSQKGDLRTSASVYEQSIQLIDDPEARSVLLNRLGDTYMQVKEYEKAIAAYRQSDQLLNEMKAPVSDDQPASPEPAPAETADTGNIVAEIEPAMDEIEVGETSTADLEDVPDETASLPEIKPEIPEDQRGETMNDANSAFDMRTAQDWNDLGNAQLKAGAYNDAISAFTKAIELSPDTCWPYIKNLAHVHYQKGKVRGRLSINETDDPDVWDGDDEPVSESLFGCPVAPDAERNEIFGDTKPVKAVRAAPAQPEAAAESVDETTTPQKPCACKMAASQPSVDAVPDTMLQESPQAPQAAEEIDLPASQDAQVLPDSPMAADEPQSALDWNELGNMHTRNKQFDEAIKAYKRAIELNPQYGQPYTNLGFIYYHLGKYQVAILLYKKSFDFLDTPEDKAISWNRLGDAYRRLGDYRNALAAYQRSSETVPTVSPVMARARATLLENAVAG
jgi:tetratricopeptide (TPR) repeat protein